MTTRCGVHPGQAARRARAALVAALSGSFGVSAVSRCPRSNTSPGRGRSTTVPCRIAPSSSKVYGEPGTRPPMAASQRPVLNSGPSAGSSPAVTRIRP
ncbi:hypothetical protein ACFSTC_15485 [Nonomuraea ferruginea]